MLVVSSGVAAMIQHGCDEKDTIWRTEDPGRALPFDERHYIVGNPLENCTLAITGTGTLFERYDVIHIVSFLEAGVFTLLSKCNHRFGRIRLSGFGQSHES